jgi:hypothetical protein
MSIQIPLIEREDALSKNCKMACTITVVVIIMMWLSNSSKSSHNSHSKIHMPTNCRNHKHSMEAMSSDTMKWSTTGKPVNAQYIVLINNNKKKIPINKLVIVQKNRQLVKVSRKDAKHINHNDKGITMTFDLGREFVATQIILDVSRFYKSRDNIATTQVEIRDKDYKIVWSSDKQLPSDKRYIYLQIVETNIIYPIPQEILCNGSTIHEQENILTANLQTNVW